MFKSRGDIVYKCTVRLLEDTEILECEFHPSYKGKYLLEHVCQQLHLHPAETDYFGLRYVDSNGQRHWLHMAKLILKQVKDASPILFSFRVKFYPPAPGVLSAGARWQLGLQLRRDLLHARLAPTPPEAALLAALIVQMELGDYDPAVHVGNYVSEMRLLLRQTDAIEQRILELHRTPAEGTALGAEEASPAPAPAPPGAGPGPGYAAGAGGGGVRGLAAADAERAFLKLACQLDTYGLDPHPVKDQRGQQLYVGAGHAGIVALSGGRRLHHFRWPDVHKINFEGRMFIVHLNYPEKKHTVGFKCPSGAACRHLWCCAIEQMLFFTLPSSAEASVYSGGGLFSWGTKFRYCGRTERELLAGDSQEENGSVSAGGGGGGRRKASSVPATPSTPMTNDFGYSSLPRSTHSAPLEEAGPAGAGVGAECAGGGCLLAAGGGACGDEPPPPAPPPAPDDRAGVVSRAAGGAGEGGSARDSFEHSSTESGGGGGGGGECGSGARAGATAVSVRRFSWARALGPALALSLAALGALLLLALEAEVEAGGLRAAGADLRALRLLYYAPLRDYLRRALIRLF